MLPGQARRASRVEAPETTRSDSPGRFDGRLAQGALVMVTRNGVWTSAAYASAAATR